MPGINLNVKHNSKDEKTRFILDCQERILGLQLVMNVNCDKYVTLIKIYSREYLSKDIKYTKTLHYSYNFLKA